MAELDNNRSIYVKPTRGGKVLSRKITGWCLNDYNKDCSDLGDKCADCANYYKNNLVSHFVPKQGCCRLCDYYAQGYCLWKEVSVNEEGICKHYTRY